MAVELGIRRVNMESIMVAMSEEQFAVEDAERKLRKLCVDFLKRGLTVIYDQRLLKELEIKAGFSPKVDVDEYCRKMTTALEDRARELYDARALNSCIHEARVNLAEYGME